MMMKVLLDVMSNLYGEFSFQTKEGYVAVGPASTSSCSLSDFCLWGMHYEAEYYLFTLELLRGLPVIPKGDDWSANCELSRREEVRISLKYCVLRNCLLSCNVDVSPNKYIFFDTQVSRSLGLKV